MSIYFKNEPIIEPSADMQLQAMLQEYSELRQERRTIVQHQNTMIALIASTLGVLLTVSLNIYIDDKFDVSRYGGLIAFMYCAIIPGILAFMGILWLDNVYRQVKLGAYVSIIEKKVNYVLGMSGMEESSAMFWEQWNYNLTKNRSFLGKINHYQYYMCMGLFLIAPWGSLFFGLFLTEGSLAAILSNAGNLIFDLTAVSVFGGCALYLLFWAFAVFYVRTVLKLNKTADSEN